jgi:hypothetical protein
MSEPDYSITQFMQAKLYNKVWGFFTGGDELSTLGV